MLDDVFQTFEDRDGNFLQQFQTTGFDSRFFELYLHAYFERSGVLLPLAAAVPDFLVDGGEMAPRIAVEATTINPSESGVLAEQGRTIADLNDDELTAYRRHELALRYGSPLYSKLQKRYWELPQCEDIPIVIAIQAFHDDDALGLADTALTSYLYGIESSAGRAADDSLVIEFNEIHSHRVGEKEIPSSFFDQENAEHISAVLFTNSGTHGKFTRMGFQSGIANDRLGVVRRGYALNESPVVTDPVFFQYSLDSPPFLETWGQGAVVIHNPRALHRIPFDAFPNAVNAVLDAGMVRHFVREWHPFTSHTLTFDMGEVKEACAKLPVRLPQVGVGAITREEFEERVGEYTAPEKAKEDAWFTDEAEFIFGILFTWPDAGVWGYRLYGRDQYFEFCGIEETSGIADRRSALERMYGAFTELLQRPQRIFPRD